MLCSPVYAVGRGECLTLLMIVLISDIFVFELTIFIVVCTFMLLIQCI